MGGMIAAFISAREREKDCRTSVSLADNNNEDDKEEKRKERMAVKVGYGAIRPFVC